MEGFANDRYVPIVLTKQGERSAMKETTAEVKATITPLFVVSPIDWDFDAGTPAKNIDAHLSKLPGQLVASWGGTPAFVDGLFLGDGAMLTGEHPLVWLVERCRSEGLPLVPVVSTDRSPTYIRAVGSVVRSLSGDACLRLPIDQWPATAGLEAINSLLVELGLAPDAVHLVLDLAEETGAAALSAVASELRALPFRDDWRSVTVAASAMPKEMPGGAGLHVLPRGDWLNYRALLHPRVRVERTPSYGDYVIANPDPVTDIDPKIMSISATLRYTAEEDWLVAKGGLFKGNAGRGIGGDAVPPACRLLTAHPEFKRGHCGFEAWIEAAADGGSPGNATTWRKEGTRHHLQSITEQLASLAAS